MTKRIYIVEFFGPKGWEVSLATESSKDATKDMLGIIDEGYDARFTCEQDKNASARKEMKR
jgi:hypothetical protein